MNREFTPRMKQILIIMLREDSILSVQKLSDELGVSKRTVQRELEYLGNSLKKYNLEFKSKTGIGVWLSGPAKDREQLYQQLVQHRERNYFDRNERRKQLTLEMLKDKSPKKLFYYSDLFGVSEATIGSDLEEIRPWFQNYHLDIVRRPGLGISLEGSEKDYRQAVSAFLYDNLNSDMIREVYENRQPSAGKLADQEENREIYQILDSEILGRVSACILALDDKRVMSLTEDSFFALVLHVTIAITRIVKEEIIDESPAFIQKAQNDECYELAKFITDALEKEFDIEIPEIEVSYVCLHIEASKRQMVEEPERSFTTLGEEQRLLAEIVSNMIDAFDSSLSYSLKQDEEFVQGLYVHLQPTIIRLKYDMKIKNPLLDQIKMNYPTVYQKCRRVAGVLEEEFQCEVPEAEIGFLAIHFGAAVVRLENQKASIRKVNVGVVCASGIGISRLMSNKIKKGFKDRVEVQTFARGDLTPYVLEQMDFFVSSIYGLGEQADILYVSPLLLESDMGQIAQKIAQYEYTEKKKKENESSVQFGQIHYLAGQMKSIIKNMGFLKVDESISFDEVLTAISEQLSPYNDRRNMIQEDIKRREALGTQIYADYGFALLHCRTKGVVRPVFSICVTRTGADFSGDALTGIRSIITMLIPDDEYVAENSEIFGYVSEMLVEDETFLDTIKAGDRERIREQLSGLLKKYFQQYINRM